jgi:alkanesulfonate monooxygenase SsuD/methylene tetrahydromethanopterin reductase-like flavin-dependent oxidoreductase (luciferase family)
MKFISFHLMPYRPIDLEETKKYRSPWVVLPNSMYDPVKGAEEYAAHIDFLVDGERLGFDGIAVNEHHQTTYGMMPAPNLIASVLIARTKKVKVAVLGRALPLTNNPIFIAEEFAMLDNLSKGRLICGFVRGIGAEYHSAAINPYFSHERFHEAHDLIIEAWTKPGPFPFQGKHYNFEYVNLWPRLYQTPHPPIWIPSQGSRETVEWAADPKRKYPFLVTFSTAENVVRFLNTYRDQARKFGYEPEAGQFGWACPVYVADTDERAKEEAGRAIENMFNYFLRMPPEMLMPPGYTSQTSMANFMKVFRSSPARGSMTADYLIGSGTALIGSPKTVLSKIEEMRDKTGVGLMLPMCQFGTLPDDLAKRSIERFATEVMPRLR